MVELPQLGERTIWLDCDVLQADGGTRTASITGGYVALASAIQRLLDAKVIKKSPLLDSVAAISVGVVGGEILLDLPYAEDARAEVDMNVVRTGGGQLVEVQGTGEDGTFDRKQLDQMLDIAEKGLDELTRAQQEILAR